MKKSPRFWEDFITFSIVVMSWFDPLIAIFDSFNWNESWGGGELFSSTFTARGSV